LLWIVFLAIVGSELIFVLHEVVTVWTWGNFLTLRVNFINFFMIWIHTVRFLNVSVLILRLVRNLVVIGGSFFASLHSISKQVRLLAEISTVYQARILLVAILWQFLFIVEIFYSCHMHFHCVDIASHEHLMRTSYHSASLDAMIGSSN